MLDIDGDIFYINNDNLLHREDGPSIEFKSGIKWWLKNGRLNRDDGPAILNKKYKEYWVNGHRANEEEIKNIKRNYWIRKMI